MVKTQEPVKTYPVDTELLAKSIVKQTKAFGVPFAGTTFAIDKAEELNAEQMSEANKEIVKVTLNAPLEKNIPKLPGGSAASTPAGLGSKAPTSAKKIEPTSVKDMADKDKK